MRILVVDDEPSNLEEIDRILTSFEYDVQTDCYLNPLDALESAKTTHYEAALLDIQMPGLSGLGLAAGILRIQPETPIIFLTAFNSYATEAFDLNARDYVLKPIRPERLLKAVNRIASSEQLRFTNPLVVERPKISAFGGLSLFNNGCEVSWDRVKTSELFAYLLMRKGQNTHKDDLCDELWPNLDEQRALANLQVTMSRLRKTLSCYDRSQVCITFSSHNYLLTLEAIDYDLEQFDLLIGSADAGSLQRAVQLYSGDFLEPEGWMWAETTRSRYQKKYQHVVRKLANIYLANNQIISSESILRDALFRFEPDDKTAMLYLTACYRLGGLANLMQSYHFLEERYQRSLSINPPTTVREVYLGTTAQLTI